VVGLLWWVSLHLRSHDNYDKISPASGLMASTSITYKR
jgi:hypothetical protein